MIYDNDWGERRKKCELIIFFSRVSSKFVRIQDSARNPGQTGSRMRIRGKRGPPTRMIFIE
jgi:hypothetical protein